MLLVGYLWCIVRQFVRAAAGRQRLNVLAGLDAITQELITVSNETYINAQSVCELLHKVAALPVGVPITLVLAGARYRVPAVILAQGEPDRAVMEVREKEDAERKILRELCRVQGSHHHMHCRRADEAQG